MQMFVGVCICTQTQDSINCICIQILLSSIQMGYAKIDQVTAGIHFRLWCRTFIIANSLTGPRIILVTLDTQAASQIMKIEVNTQQIKQLYLLCFQVVRKLKAIYGSTYTDENVLLSGTHTHSGPGGYWQYVLFEVISLGFVKESLDVIVDGVVESIKIGMSYVSISCQKNTSLIAPTN